MINLIENNINKSKLSVENVLNDIYLLPKWEKLAEFSLERKSLFSSVKLENVELVRKFSSKNRLEKYELRSIKTSDALSHMDIKVYKDCVYIINLSVADSRYFEQLFVHLVRISVEKALYNTTDKEVKINLLNSDGANSALKKLFLKYGFSADESQSEYEKNMFGETFVLKCDLSLFWIKKIHNNPVLINK